MTTRDAERRSYKHGAFPCTQGSFSLLENVASAKADRTSSRFCRFRACELWMHVLRP